MDTQKPLQVQQSHCGHHSCSNKKQRILWGCGIEHLSRAVELFVCDKALQRERTNSYINATKVIPDFNRVLDYLQKLRFKLGLIGFSNHMV